MISKKLLKDYEIKTREQYFDICIESRINGNIQQAKEQCKKIERKAFLEFITYVQNTSPENYNFFLSLLTGNI